MDVLQRYITLRRSAREPNLVVVVDGKTEALAQSVIALGQNDDVLSRFMKNPYAAALTGFGKITSFMQEQMIPALLDSDEVSQEEQIRAMRELSQREDDASKLRVNMDTASEFELVTQLELPLDQRFIENRLLLRKSGINSRCRMVPWISRKFII